MRLNAFPELRSGVNTYRPERLLGEGGSGIVFLANDEEKARVAVKVLRPGAPEKARARFRNELRFGIMNAHPNVVSILDYGESTIGDERRPFFVMPYFEETLRAALREGLGPEECLRIFSGVLDGIECAHQKGVWHRDLKPENILLGNDRREVAVADFGVAHFAAAELAEAVRTRQQERLANFRYAAPEQRDPAAEVDYRADLFALGLILNEMFTGQTPQGSGYATVAESAPHWAPLDDLVESLIQQSPEKRPRSVGIVKHEMARLTGMAFAAQSLDREKNQVVSSQLLLTPESVDIVGFDWNNGLLSVELRPLPSPAWQGVFKAGAYGHGELGGIGPEHVKFLPAGASVQASPNWAAQMLSLFKTWVASANEEFANADTMRRQEEAKAAEREREKRVQAAEERLRVISTLRL